MSMKIPLCSSGIFHQMSSGKIEVPIVFSGMVRSKLSKTDAPITANVGFSSSLLPSCMDGEYARNGTRSRV